MYGSAQVGTPLRALLEHMIDLPKLAHVRYLTMAGTSLLNIRVSGTTLERLHVVLCKVLSAATNAFARSLTEAEALHTAFFAKGPLTQSG
jgi:hypothetical protein